MGKKAELVRKIVRDPRFWVRVDAIGTGIAVTAEGVLLGIYLPAMPVLLAGAAAVAATALAGCGIYSLYTGSTGTWRHIRDSFESVYRPGKAHDAKPKPQTTFLERLAHRPKIYPRAKKLAALKPVRKFIDSPLGRKMRFGLTQAQRDIFMVGLNLKGSLFVGGAAATYLVMHTLAAPALTLGGLLTATMALATYYTVKSAFDIFCGAHLLTGLVRNRLKARKAAKAGNEPARVPARVPAPVPASSAPLPSASAAFGKEAPGPEAKAPPAAPAPPKPAQP